MADGTPARHDASGVSLDYLFDVAHRAVDTARVVVARGRVVEAIGTVIRAAAPGLRLGEAVTLRNPDDDREVMAEVVGLDGDHAILAPLEETRGISTRTEVIATGRPRTAPAGDALLGRVLDGLGRPMDVGTRGPLRRVSEVPVHAAAPDPLTRRPVDRPMPLGVRALDGVLTCGEGQRMGIFAAAGGGKSTLLSMLVSNAACDVAVLALIGERGREVREFIERDLGPEGLARSVLVVATSDRPAMERASAAYVATAIAESFRASGRRVLLLMDSVTRFARAGREIGLAAGEPPTRRGYPPSVFAELPRLLERAGNDDRGSITAFYTVLVEGDDMTEPVADEVRSILDGHIVLSRALASRGHYPAIDVLASASRVMSQVTTREHREAATKLRRLLARHDEVELLLRIGEYKPGADPETDEAVTKAPRLRAFLCQDTEEREDFDATLERLAKALA